MRSINCRESLGGLQLVEGRSRYFQLIREEIA
jgi:hypothetical protein